MMPCTVSGRTTSLGRVAQHAGELLRVQGIAAGMLEQSCLQVGVERRVAEQSVQELGGLLLGERGEQESSTS